MQMNAGILAPVNRHFEEQMTSLIHQAGHSLPACEVHSMQPLMDSVNIVPADWLRMASWIADNHLRYSGFVLVHGTDTMAYSASALAFLLRGLNKPIILTGSMIPLDQPESDALPNLVGALNSAADDRIREVCIYFRGKLLRGCRSTKVSAWRQDAFASPNAPCLGNGFPRPRLHREQLLSRFTTPSEIIVPSIPASVSLVKIFPGMNLAILEAVLQPDIQGVVLETYGMGSIPENIPGFIDLLHCAVERGCVLVSASQCFEKSPVPGKYQSGTALTETGVIAGGDMTYEAALAKLFTLLSMGLPLETIRHLIPQNLCGELTTFEGVAL